MAVFLLSATVWRFGFNRLQRIQAQSWVFSKASTLHYHDDKSQKLDNRLASQLPYSSTKLQFNASTMDKVEVYDLLCAAIVPRPIAFVSTCSADGKVNNLAMFSFFMPVTSEPPTLAFSITRKSDDSAKDTLVNILDTGHFVVNHIVRPIFDKGYQAASEYPSEVDEFEEVGFTAVPSKHGIAPIVKESPLSLECSLYKSMDIGAPKYGGSTIVVGKVLAVHVSESCWKDGRVVPQTLESISRLSAMNYGNADIMFDLQDDKVWSSKHW